MDAMHHEFDSSRVMKRVLVGLLLILLVIWLRSSLLLQVKLAQMGPATSSDVNNRARNVRLTVLTWRRRPNPLIREHELRKFAKLKRQGQHATSKPDLASEKGTRQRNAGNQTIPSKASVVKTLSPLVRPTQGQNLYKEGNGALSINEPVLPLEKAIRENHASINSGVYINGSMMKEASSPTGKREDVASRQSFSRISNLTIQKPSYGQFRTTEDTEHSQQFLSSPTKTFKYITTNRKGLSRYPKARSEEIGPRSGLTNIGENIVPLFVHQKRDGEQLGSPAAVVKNIKKVETLDYPNPSFKLQVPDLSNSKNYELSQHRHVETTPGTRTNPAIDSHVFVNDQHLPQRSLSAQRTEPGTGQRPDRMHVDRDMYRTSGKEEIGSESDKQSAGKHTQTRAEEKHPRRFHWAPSEKTILQITDYIHKNITTAQRGSGLTSTPAVVKEPQVFFIVGAWKAGASSLAEIVRSHPGVFYHHEPLKPLGLRRFGVKSGVSLMLSNFTRCHFSTREHPSTDHESQSPSVSDLGDIMQSNKLLSNACHMFWQPALCFSDENIVTRGCGVFPIHLVKTVRVELAAMRSLLAADEKGKIKVIFFYRDPRAVYYSRADKSNTEWCSRPVCADPRALCKALVSDVDAVAALSRDFPGRLKSLRYEDLASHPEREVSALFNWLELPYTDATRRYVKGFSLGSERPGSSSVGSWLKEMRLSRVLRVQKACGADLMHQLRYRLLTADTDREQFQTFDPEPRPLSDSLTHVWS